MPRPLTQGYFRGPGVTKAHLEVLGAFQDVSGGTWRSQGLSRASHRVSGSTTTGFQEVYGALHTFEIPVIPLKYP